MVFTLEIDTSVTFAGQKSMRKLHLSKAAHNVLIFSP